MNFISDDIFLDSDGTYYRYVDNSDCNAPPEDYPLKIGPGQKYNPEIPF